MNNTIKAVALGFSLLLATVSFCYAQDLGKGVIAYGNGDYATAFRELRPLAAQGNAIAQYFLGGMYTNGKGVTQDDKEAVRLYGLAADQVFADAQYDLGVMYNKGEGVIQDYKEAARLFGLAAAQGNERAQYNLGVMYDNGTGVIQDYKEAVRLYGLAADQGYASAQYNLGVMYNYGLGVIQDNVYAHMWLNIAASSGIEEAVKGRDILAGKMTASQLEKAQELARECVKKEYKGC